MQYGIDLANVPWSFEQLLDDSQTRFICQDFQLCRGLSTGGDVSHLCLLVGELAGSRSAGPIAAGAKRARQRRVASGLDLGFDREAPSKGPFSYSSS
jgi:hypothetical protein